ncbi:MAG: hypothetical protein KGS61_21750 [Verrucomicrobia bacterium]|nr:hypothetical protein [Verrucomicrobiota bacterium]
MPTWIDLDQVEDAFVRADGFQRPNWDRIRALAAAVPPECLDAAWSEVATQWVQRLRADLGGRYHVAQSGRFLLLSELEPGTVHELIGVAARTLDLVQQVLGESERPPGWGKRVILLFTELDDYYQYVSYFCRDGTNPASGGMLIRKDYIHVAAPYEDGRYIRQTLAHELTHAAVVQLPLPRWLNEGLAVTVQKRIAKSGVPALDADLRDEHVAFWNEDRIQSFWAGTSFYEPGESNKLSYSLAEILVSLLSADPEKFVNFVRSAQATDAGQTAALDVLGVSLGDTVATFLGEGNWRPVRKAIVDCWAAAGWTSKPS